MNFLEPRGEFVEVVLRGVPQPLLYRVPAHLAEVDAGHIVAVEIGRSTRVAWATRRLDSAASLVFGKPEDTSQLTLLESKAVPKVKDILHAESIFPKDQLELFSWMADYYGVSLLEVIETAVPIPQSVMTKLTQPKKKSRKIKTGETRLDTAHVKTPGELSAEQSAALRELSAAVENGQFSPFLLHGVTGSGKTEVYIRAAEVALRRGLSVLIVVPEIALTPQLLDHLTARLNSPIAMLHSEVSAGERWRTWKALLSGELRLAVGARSAIFAPLEKLGLIVVDEEHETSYKQSDNLRYHARDIAVMRAKIAGCPIVLGSATPSFESLLNVSKQRYKLLELPNRVTARPLPTIEVIDLSKIRRREMPSENISPPLRDALEGTLKAKEQAVILYNRRGFSSYLQCETCGEAVVCPNCSVTLVYHKRKHELLCHYCDFHSLPPEACRYCRDPRVTRVELDGGDSVGKLIHCGGGTERVVQELKTLFPEARIAQMDRDTVSGKDSYRNILSGMRLRNFDFLVGTQMIAKGHDLPGVTLVGMINADIGLHIPDFRASERVFQLITQAAGRAGRGDEAGHVLVQTRQPGHPTLVAAVTGKFKAFARFELDFRKKLSYPPWTRLMRIVVSSEKREDAFAAADSTAHAVRSYLSSIAREPDAPPPQVLGPAPAPHERLRGRFRAHILVKSMSARVLSGLASSLFKWKSETPNEKLFRMTLDIDPVDML